MSLGVWFWFWFGLYPVQCKILKKNPIKLVFIFLLFVLKQMCPFTGINVKK